MSFLVTKGYELPIEIRYDPALSELIFIGSFGTEVVFMTILPLISLISTCQNLKVPSPEILK